jgi:hypothetical protein
MAIREFSNSSASSNPHAPQFVDEKAAGKIISKPVSWLQYARWRGEGPPFYKLGRSIRYDVSELIEWVKAQRRTSTSEG